MNIAAFQRGFIKAAMLNGIDALSATELLKYAESSGIGRYFAEKGVVGSATLDHPYRSTAGMIPGQMLGQGLTMAGANPFAAGLVSGPLAEMGSVATFGGKENREKHYRKASDDVKSRGVGENMHHSGKKIAPLFAGLGGILGGGLGAGMSWEKNHDLASAAGQGLLGAGVGAAGGGLAGYAGGALGGAINSAETKLPSEESRQRALKMKIDHPYSTALPFGDMVGAAVS